MKTLRNRLNQLLLTVAGRPLTIEKQMQPAGALIDKENRLISDPGFHGDVAYPLSSGRGIRFQITPSSNAVDGVRLRFGTYCRTNRCHVVIKIGRFKHIIEACTLPDNDYVDIHFSASVEAVSGKPLTLLCYATDARDAHTVGLWCSRKPPEFIPAVIYKPLHFPPPSRLRVSIVIPVFNKAVYTYNCLISLLNCHKETGMEIVIVNNASTDETIRLLDHLSGAVQIIHNTENQGFVTSCRQGAEAARGEFILFLNNDTQAMPGFLSAMVRVMDARSDAGITGSKLIYPDGRLQEAGGIVFSDASGWNYGRFQDPTHPLYNRTFPVDYCSGASLMIRKPLWEKTGGFDLRYSPAYYEDTDLCFAVRQAGFQVYFCHESEVFHHEGITAGTDVLSGYKVYQNINREKFAEKWRAVLKDHCPPGTSADQAIDRHIRVIHQKQYQDRLTKEVECYRQVENVHDLPQIAHYWSNKYLLPIVRQFGFSSGEDLYTQYMCNACEASPDDTCHFISIGSGNCDMESALAEIVVKAGHNNFVMECLDINPTMLDRGKHLADQKQLSGLMRFVCSDINGWQPDHSYDIVIANHSLHHFVELEVLFEKISQVLKDEGRFLAHDMIGRNGHMRWPEAFDMISGLWPGLPDKYKYNPLFKRLEVSFPNWDCSVDSFEGIRSQDILPLLVKTFGFELFVAFGNIIDIFIDRCFGHNFDADNPDDRAFIDRIHQMDAAAIENGLIKPTHMVAAMTKRKSILPRCYKHLTPEFCIRWPENPGTLMKSFP